MPKTINDLYQIYNTAEIVKMISDKYLPLSAEAQSDFAAATTMHVLPKDSYIVKEGEMANSAYFIAAGCVKTFYFKDDKEIVDWFGFEKEFLNSFFSFFLNEPSHHYIKTLEHTILLEIPRSVIKEIGKKHVQLLKLENYVHAFIVTLLQRKMRSIHLETTLMRYESLSNFRPYVFQRIPLKDIASYLGMTVENLSRIRRQMARKEN